MKTVMIIGGCKGVGKEILKSCLKKGYNVSFCGRNNKIGDEIINNSSSKDQLYFHRIDLNEIAELENYVKQTKNKFGGIDALVLYACLVPC